MIISPQEEPRPHPGTTTGSDERPAQRLAGVLLRFDLEAELAQLQDESEWEQGDRNAITLVKEGDLRITLTMSARDRTRVIILALVSLPLVQV